MDLKLKILFFVIFVFSVPGSAFAEFEDNPIVIVPGILTSFDKKLIFQDKEDNKWSFVPFYNIYKGMIKELKKFGYEEDKNLFIAYYDWRKPTDDVVEKYLIPKIEEAKKKSGKNKVDIVAHSMGGVVTKTYIQSDDYKNDVNRFILMGTPNQGASNTYLVWEGGIFPKEWGSIERFYIERIESSLKRTRNKKDLQRPQAFREFFPALKDLLPTYNYVRRDGKEIDVGNLAEKNDLLLDLNENDNLGDHLESINVIAGINGVTLDQIDVTGNRTEEDIKLDRWRDGHPNPDPPTANSDQGDGTVLLSSATIGDMYAYTFEGTGHSKIPDDARYLIPELLNPPVLVFWQNPLQYIKNVFFHDFTVRAEDEEEGEESDADLYVEPETMFSITTSPNLEISITDPDGKVISRDQNDLGEENAYFDDDPEDPEDVVLVIFRNPKAGEYIISAKGSRGGEYYVDSSFANEDLTNSTSVDGNIDEGEAKEIAFDLDTSTGVTFQNNEEQNDQDEEQHKSNDSHKSGGSSSKKEKKSSEKPVGKVLGASTMRETLLSSITRLRLYLIQIVKGQDNKSVSAAKQLLGPTNDMLARASFYEKAKRKKGTANEAANYLLKTQQDFYDFSNKLDLMEKQNKLSKKEIATLKNLRQKIQRMLVR